jgi:hypothetical protein
MQALGLFSALVAIASGTWVGVRLASLAHRTRELPERFVAMGLLAFAVVAYPLLLVASAGAQSLPPSILYPTTAVACIAYVCSVSCLACFTRAAFRPRSLLAVVAVGLLAALGAIGAFYIVTATYRGEAIPGGSPFGASPLGSGLIATAFGLMFTWTSVEALAWHARMRRRRALGIADAVVTNRFLVWGLGSGASAIVVFGIVGCTIAGLDVGRDLLPGLLQSASGLLNALTWSLTFAPPSRYIAWVKLSPSVEVSP